MTERVEEKIRRMYDSHLRRCPDKDGLCHWTGHAEIGVLLTALAQAEREREDLRVERDTLLERTSIMMSSLARLTGGQHGGQGIHATVRS